MISIFKLFFNFDAFNYLIHKYNRSNVVVILAGSVSLIVQIGLFASPIISMFIPNTWQIGYRIVVGSLIGMFLSAIKDFFTDAERERELQEMRDKLQTHEERLSDHDKRHSEHEERFSDHDCKISKLELEIEYNKPYVYQPFDPPSP